MSRQCWLCLNSKHAEAQKMHTFMLQNISTIGAEAMADMISKHLEGVDPAGEGASREDVQRHIQGGHILSPSLQIAHTLRSLLELRDTLHDMIVVVDENGSRTVDARNIASYLKVVSEITQVYRSGEITKILSGDGR